MDDILVIGIAGGTGSGKTTLTNQIAEQLGEAVTVITHDCYYREHHELTYDERTQLNYDHPDSYETELLVEHLAALRQGLPVEVPVYDFSIYDRTDETTTVYPSRVIIVEGIVIFTSPELRDLMDIKVFVDADADVRILRRMVRDVRDRGRSVESVVNQYLATVKPMHEMFVEPSKVFADIIIPTGGKNPVALDLLVTRIRAHLA
ncbi:MAG: uridine kinase [Coriobacteriales bacterium]|jgi:uridine kinase|nr:uridine kinase [Coriobacteriales bacterium]MDO5708516.1 uridine kinase [Coriobacteriales bacterium]